VERGLRAGMVEYKGKGEFVKKSKPHVPTSQCSSEEAVNEDALGMDWQSMLGTFIISVALIVIAIAIELTELLTGKRLQQMLGYPVPEKDMSGAETQARRNSVILDNMSERLAQLEKSTGGVAFEVERLSSEVKSQSSGSMSPLKQSFERSIDPIESPIPCNMVDYGVWIV